MPRLRQLVDIRRDERIAVGIAFITLLAMVAAHSVLETARDTLFLTRISARGLPVAYLAIAISIVVVAQILGTLRGSIPGSALLPGALLLSALVTAGFWGLLGEVSESLVYALYVWSGVVGTFVVGMYWIRVGDHFDVGQAKRLFPLIGIGGVLGATAGSLLARILVLSCGAEGLILVAALIYLVAAAWVFFAWRAGGADTVESAYERRSTGMTRLEILRREPYLIRLSLLIAMSMITVTVVDYLFKTTLAAEVPAEDLGAFLSSYYTVINALSALVQVVVAPVLLRYLGVNRALVLFPLLLILSGLGLLLSAGHLIAALVMKGVDGTLRHSLYRTGMEILYLPLSSDVRARFKALLDGFAQRGGQALASLAILACSNFGFGRWELEVGVLAFSFVWFVLGIRMRSGYLDLFRERLSLGRIETRSEIPDLDLGALEQLLTALNSPDDAVVISALEMFAVYRRHAIVPALILYHPSPKVVAKAAEVLGYSDRSDVSGIAARVVGDRDPEIRAAALRLIVGDSKTFARFEESISRHSDPITEGMLAIGRLNIGKIDESETRSILARVFHRSTSESLCGLVQAMRGNDSEVVRWALIELAKFDDGELCREVAMSMGASPDIQFLPSLVHMLAHRDARIAARHALVAIGPPAMEYLERIAIEEDASERELRHIPRSISPFGGQSAVDALVRIYHATQVGMIRFRVLRGLGRLKANDPSLRIDPELIESELEACCQRVISMLDCRMSATMLRERREKYQHPAMDLLIETFRGKEVNALERFFRFLALKYPHENVHHMFNGLISSDSRVRAGSRELLDHVLEGPYRFAMRTLVDDIPDRDRLAGTAYYFDPSAGFSPTDVEAAFMIRLRSALQSSSGTIRIVAHYLVRELEIDPSSDADSTEVRVPLIFRTEPAL